MQRTIIVVQARMSSSRLPGKVMLPVVGKSILARMIERLRRVQYPVKIVIATSTEPSDEVIVQEANRINCACFRGHLTDLLDRHYKAAQQFKADVVLKIPSDCPLIDPTIVDRVLDFYFKNQIQFDYVSNLHPATYPDGNDVEIMSFSVLEKAWKEAKRPLEREHTTPYIWENPEVFRIGNVDWEKELNLSMTHRFTIDYWEDYEFIKAVYETLYAMKPDFDLNDILELLIQKPRIYELNAKYAGVNWYRHHLTELKTVSTSHTKVMI
jgi:spore coat polysaccharide biosynthesis protein SpsF